MPVLNWIGKEAVVNHDKQVPFKLLKKIKSVSKGDKSENLIIHGDNLEALKALMPYYQGKVKCIYIDPPYNTGNENWVYNDKVNSPKIKQWLGKVVGKESEDLTRHDKWLCMMYPRLKLLRELLSDDGVIFVSIDDNEQHSLRFLMDEIFSPKNFVTNIIWQKKYSPQNDATYFSDMHDFIMVYAKSRNYGKDKNGWIRNLIKRTEKQNARYKNPDNDSRGPWKPADLSVKTYSVAYDYPITTPSGRTVEPPKGRCWSTSKDNLQEWIDDNRVWFGKGGNNVPSVKIFLSEVQDGTVPLTIWLRDEVGDNQEAKQEIKKLLGTEKSPFDTPKPVRLINRIIELATDKDSIVLDSYAGSGTTGHAVLDVNNNDGGNRKFILVEMEEEIVKEITSRRVATAIDTYKFKDGFEYCELSKPLFDAEGKIDESCDFNQLASYIYFTETQTNVDSKVITGNYIGERNTSDYYLIYKGKDKNDLNESFLKKLKKDCRTKVIYADRCLLDDGVMKEYGIVFKQIPYEVKIY